MSDVKNARERPEVEPVWDRQTSPGDELKPPGTSGWPRGATGDWLIYAAVAAVAIVIGIVGALSTADDIARHGGVYDIRPPLLWDMTSIAVIILLTPVMLAVVRRIRREPALTIRIALAIATIIVFSAVHITGMVALRKLIMWLAGGAYDFRFSLATVLYEFRKDVVTCVLIGGGMWLIDSRREAQRVLEVETPPQPAGQAPTSQTIWLRDGTRSIRIEPGDILWINSAGNYVEYSMADGSNHLIRGTLAAAEAELARFNLVRIHRTRLANLDRVTSVETKPSGDFELTFDTGRTASGSRRYKSAVAPLDRTSASSGM
ncbi:LytTR family transcriptional regulator DNA-binding domain-containing protein [Bradyrhizobium lablabi]|uniref:LytTR family DNA-binding domain-containing protein n=1 Tax=Bradyrhizobium lablabi TaxID=722472 RepID=UPI001BABDCA2|nr:LytTR family DNA-binding domain-containing protein [Bradyrhizobium lablabi]MBR1122568.1 LytTR family transcriptional regulator DNA-binding domain-containing protein [Bradyrhizobium lablabi]